MRRKQTPASRASAPPPPLKPAAALGFPVKGRAARRAALPNVKLSGITASTSDKTSLLEPNDVDERQLLCAIHVLDDSAKSLCSSKSHGGRDLDSALAVQRALGFLVELTSPIDGGDASEDGSKANHARARLNKVIVCAARVLGCLKRFIAASKYACAPVHRSSETTSDPEDHCCAYKCHQTLVRLAVLLVLFNLSRTSQTATVVVAEGLEGFLLEMAQGDAHARTNDRASFADIESMKSDDESREQDGAASEPLPGQPRELLQADDLLLEVDPFDWCFQSLSIDIARTVTEGGDEAPSRSKAQHPDAAFLVPLGARTLCYLLNGVSLPTDEVQEHAQRLDHTPLTCGRCSRTAKSPHKQKPRRLPSIFAFPSGNDDDRSALARSLCFSACRSQTSTDTLTESAWLVALSSEASVHLALRSLVALAVHLSKCSPERRALAVLCQPHLRKIRAKYLLDGINFITPTDNLSSNDEDPPGDREELSQPPQLLPHHAIAISRLTLVQVATTAFLVVSGSGSQATNEATNNPSRSTKRAIRTNATTHHHAESPDSPEILSARLKAATINAQREFAVWEAEVTASKAALASNERVRRRRNIRQAINRLEQLRRSLGQGLKILRTGRSHPNPAQLFTDWIQSLPTVESHERERQVEQEMRQRLVLEKQYQLEARRRREHDERILMATNDCGVSYDAEISAQADKHARFLEMQAELRSLEDSLDSSETGVATLLPNISSDIPSPTRRSSAELEKERDKQLAKQQRERAERARLQQLRCQEHEARECTQMRCEDLFFAKRALRQQEHAWRQSESEAVQQRAARERAMEAQRQKIAEMRERELDTKRARQEADCMRVEELHSRQLRFFLAEQAKFERQHELATRKRMQAEEQDSRWRWQLFNRAAAQQEQAERNRQRAEERRARRQMKEQQQTEFSAEAATRAAGDWVQCWDNGGNAYYYNSRTGVSQWDPPASC